MRNSTKRSRPLLNPRETEILRDFRWKITCAILRHEGRAYRRLTEELKEQKEFYESLRK